MRPQELVLECCNLRPLGIADGLYEWGYSGRIFWEELISGYDFEALRHSRGKDGPRCRTTKAASGVKRERDALPGDKIDHQVSEVHGVFIGSTVYSGKSGPKTSQGCRAYRSSFWSGFVETFSAKSPNSLCPCSSWHPRERQDSGTIRRTLLYTPLSSIPKEPPPTPPRSDA